MLELILEAGKSLIGGFWPYIIGAGAFLATLVAAYFKGASGAKAKRAKKDAEGRLKTIDERERHARDAETQDDTTLADRLTRRD